MAFALANEKKAIKTISLLIRYGKMVLIKICTCLAFVIVVFMGGGGWYNYDKLHPQNEDLYESSLVSH